MVDHGEKFPPEGPGHFSVYLEKIKAIAAKSPGPTIEPMVWSSVHQFGDELSRFAREGKVTPQEAGFRQQMASFMSEGANRTKYKSYLKEVATFWWEDQPEEKTPTKAP